MHPTYWYESIRSVRDWPRRGCALARATCVACILFTSVAGPAAAQGRNGNMLPRIAVLSLTSLSPNFGGFTDRLRQLGYVEGRNIVIEHYYAEGSTEKLDQLAAEVVRSHVDVIFAISPPGATAARKATDSIPIVFMSISNPVGMGLIESMGRPGGNITGVANMPTDLNIKRLEMLKDVMPGLRRVAIITRSGNPNHQVNVAGQVAAARKFGMQPYVYSIAGPADFDSAFAGMARDGVQAACAVQDVLFFAARKQYMETALRYRIPVIADGHEYAEAGAVISYGVRYRALHDRAAVYVDKILKGAKPGVLPIEQPTEIELVVNLRIARELNVRVPLALIMRANRTIE
jgi:putative ABC transport system substrate-binding protein